jgi:hypothetical protein
MMKTLIFSVSLLANLVLVTHVVLVELDDRPVHPNGAATLASTSKVSQRADSVDDAAELEEQLLNAGMPESHVKAMLLAYLNARIAESAAFPTYEYWRAESQATAQARAAAMEERRETVREALLALHGVAAKEDPAFWSVFKPLQSRFPFLTSEQQIAVGRLLQQQAAAPPVRSAPAPGSRPKPAVAPPFEAELRQIIPDTATYLEFSMRDSPLAQRLRSAAIDFTEDEYRRVFSVMEEFRADPKPSAFLAQREAVHAILGRDRALQLWGSIDSTFAAVRKAGEQHNLSDATIWAAYELLLDAQDDLLRVGGSASAAVQANVIAERVQRRDRMLTELVGDAAASSIAAATSQRINELRGAQPPFPQANRVVSRGGQP